MRKSTRRVDKAITVWPVLEKIRSDSIVHKHPRCRNEIPLSPIPTIPSGKKMAVMEEKRYHTGKPKLPQSIKSANPLGA